MKNPFATINGDVEYRIPDRGGRLLIRLYDETKDEQYKEAAQRLRRSLDDILGQKGISAQGVSADMETFADVMPFYIEYETRFNKKNGYNDICLMYSRIWEQSWNEEAGRLETDGIFDLKKELLFLESIVEGLDVMSIQIYEDYDLLRSMLKKAVRGLVMQREMTDADAMTAGLAAGILLKSIRRGYISAEKYESVAKLYASKLMKSFPDGAVEAESAEVLAGVMDWYN
jgi:hypothetical protein